MGSIYDVELVARFLELDREYDVYTFTLPGHERTIGMKNEYIEWIQAAEKEVEYLINNGYKKIYLLGHSMGGVIAPYLATKYKEIKKLVLAAPAFKYFYDKDDKLKVNISNSKNLLSDYGYEEILMRILKTSIKSTKEFMGLINKYYDIPKKIKIPTLIVQGLKDNLVKKESSEYVYNNLLGRKVLVYVRGANHDIFHSDSIDKINVEIKKFLKCRIIKDDISVI